MRKLIFDLSPCLYGSLFSATNEVKKNGAKPVKKDQYQYPKFHFDYGDILSYKILDEISKLKTQFAVDEVIIAVDNSDNGGYWRKDYWAGYKFTRKKTRDESEIEWDQAYKVFDIVKNQIRENTSYKVVEVQRAEADDVIFVLSEHFSDSGDETVIFSVDHDMVYNMKHPGVSVWKDNRTSKKDSCYRDLEISEILELELDHLIGGDAGDYIKNVKAYSVFSKEFLKMYPNYKGKELQVWDKRHEIDIAFMDKTEKSAYKHPRYGYKMFLKSDLTVRELLDQNPIYRKNYELNKLIALPDGIPQDIRKSIMDMYESAPAVRNAKALKQYFKENHLFKLMSSLPFL